MNFNEIINSPKPVLVDFYADWCGPCYMMAPILKEVSTEMSDKMKVVKVDV
ncbi:MAG: thioredoxin domain-containing protein, partial [Bacteroidota bacterium]